MAASTGDPALDAAQRWNAMNCSYFYSSGTSAPISTNSKNTSTSAGKIDSSQSTPSTANASSIADISKLYEAGGGENKWSPELKDYVRRTFLSAETKIESDQLERILRQKIEYVFRNNVSVDWTKEPLPTIPKIPSFNAPTPSPSSINLVRPANLQPWKTRRNAGSLQTGTLTRNQTSSINTRQNFSYEKPNYLSVQRIQTDFTAKVYETHADIALEVGDSHEFHQCQSQLALLHADGFGSSRRLEFTAYRLLYYISTGDLLGMNKLLSSLKSTEKLNPYMRFALKVRAVWSLGNYKRFFDLACNPVAAASYETETSSMHACRCVLAWSLERERKSALRTIFKTYRPTLSMDFITETLGFTDKNSCAEFITEKLAVVVENLAEIDKVDCKEVWSQMIRSGTAAASED
ncbi:hypothetical protein Aperf_G00000056164 [Anoplocephala perfoliata]